MSNLLGNPGFEVATAENKPEGWTNPGGLAELSKDAARTGNNGVRMKEGTDYFQRGIETEPGTTFEASAWVRTAGTFDRVAIKFEYWGASGYIGGDQADYTWSDDFGDWTKIKQRATTPDETTRMSVLFRVYNGEADFDDVTLYRLESDDE